MHRTLLALVVVLAAGPALAGSAMAGETGSFDAGQPASIDTGLSASIDAGQPGSIAVGERSGIATGTVDAPAAVPQQGAQACSYPLEVTDATGETVVFEEEPDEVVVTLANVAQHLWDLGSRDTVTGLPHAYTGYLEGNEEPANVLGPQGNVDVETVVGLEPDLVLAPNATFAEDIEALRNAGLTVYHYRLATDLDEVVDRVERTGTLVGECENATAVTTEMGERIDAVEQAVDGEQRPGVYYDMGFPYTATAGTLEHELITTAGGENVAGDVGDRPYTQINEEVLAAEGPEWILVGEGQSVSDVGALQSSTAVENDQILEVKPHLLSQHGPRSVQAVEEIAEALHPEAMAGAGEENGTDQSGGDDDESDSTGEDDSASGGDSTDADDGGSETDADGNGAGLTVLAAALALGVVGVLGRRRAD